ncbi:MAG: GNAT family N-acetyltransferase [Saprospiraceae bacterium]|nr:GNAT family N-acetyltransferase [Saprospiraceae bacterium]
MKDAFLEFETERLLIRPTNFDDAPFLLLLLNTPKWLEFIGDRKVYDLPASRNYIKERIIPQFYKWGFGNYTLIRKMDKIPIGCCGLYDRPGVDGIDLGFALMPAFEKYGYALEAAQKMLEIATDIFKLNKVSAITSTENMASQNLLRKLGMKYQGLLSISDEDDPVLLFQLSKIIS